MGLQQLAKHGLSQTFSGWSQIAICPIKWRLLVYDAVVIWTRLLIGLEALQLTEARKSRLNTFHLRRLRQSLHIQTVLEDRRNTNAEGFRRADAFIHADRQKRTQNGTILVEKRTKLPAHVFRFNRPHDSGSFQTWFTKQTNKQTKQTNKQSPLLSSSKS